MLTFFKALYTWFKMLPLWEKIGIVIILFVVVPGSFFLPQFLNQQTGYVFDTAKKTTITEIVTDSGKILSDGKVEVNSPTNGIVTAVNVQNGQWVKEDDQLFTVKSSATVQEQQTAFAAYQAAVAAENTAETLLPTYRAAMYTKWKTFTDLATNSTYESSKGVPNTDNRKNAEFQVSQDTWLAAEKQFLDQEQAVAAATAQVNAAWTAYLATQTTTATAPIDGLVENLAISPGKSVSVPTILNPTAKPVLTIVNSATVEAVLNIGQTDIAKVKPGQLVKIHPDPYKDKEYEGKVIRVDKLGQDLLGVITYNVYVEFKSLDEILRAGMTVDGDIITNQQERVLTVPNAAIVLYQGGKAVRILGKNNTIQYIPVKVGIRGDTRTEILEGISEGQQIISALTNEKAASPGFMGL